MTSKAPERDLLTLAMSGKDPSEILARTQKDLADKPDDPLLLVAQGVTLQRRRQ